MNCALPLFRFGLLAFALGLAGFDPAYGQVSSEKAFVTAANHARRCQVDMVDGKVKCAGRAVRSLSAAKELLLPGKLLNAGCNGHGAVWAFAWRAFPSQAPIAVDAETGKLVRCVQ